MGRRSEWEELRVQLRAAGYEVWVNGGSGHWDVYRGNKRVWYLAYSASDHRSFLNTIRDLKRKLGFEYKKGR